jgi:hypothetical protein
MEELRVAWREAQRAEDIAAALYRIRPEVDFGSARDIEDVVLLMRRASEKLKDLYDLAPIYSERVAAVVEYLPTLLPCLGRTLEDIRQYLSQAGLASFQRIWINIVDHLLEEAQVRPVERFRVYSDFLTQLVRLLSRSDVPSL